MPSPTGAEMVEEGLLVTRIGKTYSPVVRENSQFFGHQFVFIPLFTSKANEVRL